MFKELLRHAIVVGGRKSWPTYDGKGELDRTDFLTSSEVASCLRKAFYGKSPDKFPTKTNDPGNGFASRGDAIEAWVVEKLEPLKALGYQFRYMGKEQRSFYDPEIGISGTPDGLMITPDGKFYLLEIKSIDPRYNKAKLPKKQHVVQTIQNWHLVEHCLGIKLDGAYLIYFDASDLYDIAEFPVAYDPEVIKTSVSRAQTLWNSVAPEELEAEGVFNGDCDHCPFTHHCSATVDLQKMLEKAAATKSPFSADLLPIPTDRDSDLTPRERAIMKSFLDSRNDEKNAANRKAEFEDEAKKIVLDHDKVVVIDGMVVSARMDGGRVTIDKKLMEADKLDVSKYEKRGAPFVVVTVK